MAEEAANALGGEWTNGLCGCFGDIKLCLITYIVPCYTAGKNAEAVGEDCVKYGIFSVLPIANFVCGAKIRRLIREQKGIAGTPVNDCLMHICCTLCALVQEAREVSNQQVDQAIDRQ